MIGTLNEGSLHAQLKAWYRRPGDEVEAPVDGYVIDLVRDGLLIEIQTGGFSSLKTKLGRLLEEHRVRLVAPIAKDRRIVKIGEGGEILSSRLSPKHGRIEDLFGKLVSLPGLLGHDRFELEVLLTVEEEHRTHQPGKAWRRQGWVVSGRSLTAVHDSRALSSPDDLVSLLPGALREGFTTADLSESLGCPRRLAQQMVYCLRETGKLTVVGKQGNALRYSRAAT